MEPLENEQVDSGQTKPAHTSLISGLPDDIALICLSRVPRRYHPLLKCVSKRWRVLVCSEEFHSYRRVHSLEESWIYALCKDKSEQICCYVLDPTASRRCWKLLQSPPPKCLKRKGMACEVLGKRFYLLGGCSWSEDAADEVYCYDASKNTWEEAAPLSTGRCYCVCEALHEKLYAIGGVVSNSGTPHSWDTYDQHTNSWSSHSDSKIVHDVQDSVVFEGKIYIRCCSFTTVPHASAILYEPSSETWQHVDADMASGWKGPAVVVDETLFVLDQSSGTRLMMWQHENRDWVPVGRLSPLLTRPPCRLVAIGKSIFIIGKGLSTVVIDLDNARNVGGALVSTSIPTLTSDVDVISCKLLSI
ncbi:PREDICTED: F-box/kelch-repeat protein SKIP4 [Nelumbo nucifera]|uniref:F-box/kelch-repeat protein SKIP4 n=2 Tax=Nelumbo nucifera TaxID=4432 RepID=A0A1U8B828_NELNU|nr:PREDICTED: F-box/kelch-repeat protein SKIP4 [Nelumbo nucifera]DAD45998.1 TPA_asm: hypothetical protein HUJ06_004228 [Nelumbo nucifera]